jgi:hypothetical protein
MFPRSVENNQGENKDFGKAKVIRRGTGSDYYNYLLMEESSRNICSHVLRLQKWEGRIAPRAVGSIVLDVG